MPGAEIAQIRIARPTDDIAALVRFYRDGLGFKILSKFEDHEGFDGVMLGQPGSSWHLEFTHHRGHQVGKAPTDEHLLVIYLPDAAEWKQAIARLEDAGWSPTPSRNPYWDRHGRTFHDPDGYGVVLQNAAS